MDYPYFPFKVEPFIGGTYMMTAEEVGGYIRLLIYQWDKGFIPEDTEELLRISGMKEKALKTVIKKFKVKCTSGLQNGMLEEVRIEVAAKFDKNRANGGKGGRKKGTRNKPKENPTVSERLANANPDETQTEPIKKSILTNTQKGFLSETQIEKHPSGVPGAPAATEPVIDPNRPDHAPQWEAVYEFFWLQGKQEEAVRFFNYYEGTGWMKGITPIRSWRHFANMWTTNPIAQREQQQIQDGLTAAERAFIETFNEAMK